MALQSQSEGSALSWVHVILGVAGLILAYLAYQNWQTIQAQIASLQATVASQQPSTLFPQAQPTTSDTASATAEASKTVTDNSHTSNATSASAAGSNPLFNFPAFTFTTPTLH